MVGSAVMLLLLASAGGTAVADVAASVVGIVPLRTTVAEAVRRLGDAPSVECGTCGESDPVARCYFGGSGDDRTFLLVESDAAGGYGKTVTGFILTQEPPDLRIAGAERQSGRGVEGLCSETALVKSGISLSNGLRLGMGREEAIRRLGTPTSETSSDLYYLRERLPGRRHQAGSEPSADIAALRVEFKANRITLIHVERSDLL